MAISWDRNSSITIGTELPLRCAAQYVRMSTEHQKYSTDNQQDAIAVYAAERGYRIVKTYADEGKSGLKIEGRRGLQQLLNDIKNGQSDYSAVLVYDISRWGRFQDPDESASYELLCRQAGIEVHYCAEQFENDGSISSSIIKTVKRAMAGEYSRELSVKVFAGHANLIRLGFRQGSAPGYGLRRLLVDQDGSPKGILNSGEHKSIQTDRVMLVPGPWQEQEVVREIFGRMANGDTERNIANDLNNRKIAFSFGKLWTRATIHNLVINEKYIGHNVWGRKSCKLKQGYTVNHPQDWIRRDNAFEAIVDVEIFRRVQDIIAARSKKISDDEMLERLRAILECNRRLEYCGWFGTIQCQLFRYRVSIIRTYFAITKLVALLFRSCDHALKIGFGQLRPSRFFITQCNDQRTRGNPTFSIQFKFIKPRLMPQCMRYEAAEISI